MQESEVPETSPETTPKRVEIQKIYIKDISYETVNTPRIFSEQWEPKVSREIKVSNTLLEEACYEVVLRITITINIGDKVAYLIEVKQAGIFNLLGGPTVEETQAALTITCPTVLLPYAREAVTDLSARGGFPPLIIQHVNFVDMYQGFLQKNNQALNNTGGDILAG